MIGFHRSEQDASEVFSVFTERVWRGLERFAWDCSFRTWAYTVARNASRNYREEEGRRAKLVDREASNVSLIATVLPMRLMLARRCAPATA